MVKRALRDWIKTAVLKNEKKTKGIFTFKRDPSSGLPSQEVEGAADPVSSPRTRQSLVTCSERIKNHSSEINKVRWWASVRVARYSFSGPIPSMFEHKLRRQSFGKIATTVVLDEDENLLWSGLQRHRSCHSNEMTVLLRTFLRKSFTGAFYSNSSLDVSEV